VIDAEVADEGYVAKLSPDLLPWNKTQDKVRPPSETLGLGFVFTATRAPSSIACATCTASIPT
jgi:hypothetical protein